MNGYKWFEKVDVEVGKSCKKEISVRVPPETEMKKLKNDVEINGSQLRA